MPVDYSKWVRKPLPLLPNSSHVASHNHHVFTQDALELSDDSDIEVHPNVDKRSFIRAKQNQIHQERLHRKHEIETLKYERIINDGLLTRIDNLVKALKAHAFSAGSEDSNSSEKNSSTDEVVFQSLIESSGDPKKDSPPPRPEGVHTKLDEQPTYSKMMASLVDQVKQEVDKQKPEPRLGGYIKEIGSHRNKVLDLQQELLKRLAELEKLEGAKITSESIHTGFSSSHVARHEASSNKGSKSSAELLNKPPADSNAAADSGSEGDIEDAAPPTPKHVNDSPLPTREIQPTALGRAFASLPYNDYRRYFDFIMNNASVLAERETDGLLMEAFDLQYAGREKEAKQAVHQALLLQYCRTLGNNGVQMFFKKITTNEPQARKVFFDDVNNTYSKLRDRSREMMKEGAGDQDGTPGENGVEQIQLHAVNPGQKILIVVPPSPPEPGNEKDDTRSEEDKQSYDTYQSFPPGLQRALQTGELDEVNKVLGKMSVDEGESTVAKLSEGGMLSLEEGIVDATTEKGKKELEELEKYHRERQQQGGEAEDAHATAAGPRGVAEDVVDTKKKAVDEVD